ncbi:MAG: hypothetical protein EXQ67_00840 [Thermoleophilia bacterium]|nr:hypothetical protein [Thermoleophilia bacterium]
MALLEADYEARPLLESIERVGSTGRSVVLVGAHGGAGTSTAALAIARGGDRGVCLVDADLAGGTLGVALGLKPRIGDAGLAGVREADGTAFATLAQRAPFGWFVEIGPRPELVWLIRDGTLRALTRQAMRQASLIVIDVARPVGPSCEPVLDADVVVIVGHANRLKTINQTQQRLTRLGVDAARIVVCPTAPTIVERISGRLRGKLNCIDVQHGDELLLLIEGRIASLGPRKRG